jgi:hypothetical protein
MSDDTVEQHHEGPIHSTVAGRTDHLPMTVTSGSYVIPADVVGGLAEGNTIAGFKVLKRMFHGLPRGAGPGPYRSQGGPYNSGPHPYGVAAPLPYNATMKRGGSASGVPIVAAGGEHVLTPDEVRMAGDGDLDRGHRVLDKFVVKMRKMNIKTLKHLDPPRKD